MVDLNELVRQAKEMQEKVKLAQEELANIDVEGASGGGLVRIVMSALRSVRRVSIDPSLMAGKREDLEDLLVAAFNNAKDRAEEISASTMEEATNGLKLPGGL